jgi:hypothetical protein
MLPTLKTSGQKRSEKIDFAQKKRKPINIAVLRILGGGPKIKKKEIT